jgi:gamma-butyrobetaine dioxygenase
MSAGVDAIVELFANEGAGEYLGEPVTQAEHMLQAGMLAEAAGAPPALIAAALLHDVGHFHGTVTGRDLMRGIDNHHSDTGADWLGQWFGPEVCEPVRLHVAAKRYLCAVEPTYFAQLSSASVHTLQVQGGPMQVDEVAAFEAGGFAEQAVALRRWDELAKHPDASTTPTLDHFLPLLESLIR